MFDERVSAPGDPGVYGWLLGFRSLPDANGRLIDAATGVLMVLVEHRGFTAIAIALSLCPCAQPAPIAVLCLVDEGVDIVPDVALPKPRPRAHARRRRSRTVTHGKSADPDGDGPGPSPNHPALTEDAMKRSPNAPACSKTDQAVAAAHAILEIVFDDDPELPAGELHCRVFSLLLEHFDDIAKENEADCRALLAARRRP